MKPKLNTGLWTMSAAALAGVLSFSIKAKNTAIKHLNKAGAFDAIQEERDAALQQLPEMDATRSLAPDTQADKWADNPTVQKINQRYRQKKKDIIENEHANDLSGAWNILSPKERVDCLSFSAINSIVAGAVTYTLTHAINKSAQHPSKKGHRKSDGSCGTVVGCGGATHSPGHGGSHHCGLGCASGCGGGCGGGGS